MLPVQSKMARAALGWGTRELKVRVGISHDTLARLERGDPTIKEETFLKLQAAYEAAGIIFVAENGAGPGVRLPKTKTTTKPPKKRVKPKAKA